MENRNKLFGWEKPELNLNTYQYYSTFGGNSNTTNNTNTYQVNPKLKILRKT